MRGYVALLLHFNPVSDRHRLDGSLSDYRILTSMRARFSITSSGEDPAPRAHGLHINGALACSPTRLIFRNQASALLRERMLKLQVGVSRRMVTGVFPGTLRLWSRFSRTAVGLRLDAALSLEMYLFSGGCADLFLILSNSTLNLSGIARSRFDSLRTTDFI